VTKFRIFHAHRFSVTFFFVNFSFSPRAIDYSGQPSVNECTINIGVSYTISYRIAIVPSQVPISRITALRPVACLPNVWLLTVTHDMSVDRDGAPRVLANHSAPFDHVTMTPSGECESPQFRYISVAHFRRDIIC